MLDKTRYPLLAEYLDGLPAGLESYADCESKASLANSAVEGHDATDLQEGLPAPVRALIHSPQPAGVWIPAVHADAVFFAVCDRHYTTEEAVVRWTYDRSMAMAKNPLYRALLRVPGPRILLKAGARAHGLFQRGTDFDIDIGDGEAEITLSFPPRLHLGLNLAANTALWRAMVRIVGGRNVQCQLASTSDTRAVYQLTYD